MRKFVEKGGQANSSPIEIVESPVKVPKKAKGLKDCIGEHWYGGIGLKQDITDHIVEIAKGYPAQKAGLKVSDFVVKVEGDEIRGVPGTTVTIIILRQGTMLTFHIVRDKICIG